MPLQVFVVFSTGWDACIKAAASHDVLSKVATDSPEPACEAYHAVYA
jgi:hypothetical protein